MDMVAGNVYPTLTLYYLPSACLLRWEVDEVLVGELVRNLLLALAMVTLVTLLLLADLPSCLLVPRYTWYLYTAPGAHCCAAHTGGHHWTDVFLGSQVITYKIQIQTIPPSIDIVCGTNLIICVGLCVDYAAHIAHSFLTVTGTADQRMKRSASVPSL